jgi:hypothetical protein
MTEKKASKTITEGSRRDAVGRAYARSAKSLRLTTGQGKAILAAVAHGTTAATRQAR